MSSSSTPFCWTWIVDNPPQPLSKSSNFKFSFPIHPLHLDSTNTTVLTTTNPLRLSRKGAKPKLSFHVKNNGQKTTPTAILIQEEDVQQPNKLVEDSVKLLKNAAKTRKAAAEEVLSALSVMEKAKLDPSGFLDTLGGSKSPGRTWMLIFTAEKKLKGGKYFPVTAVQRFDAAAKVIENGVFLGPLGWLTFEGRFSWKKRILAFVFERVKIKIGPFNPFQISFKGRDEREPGTKDPFFIWFYVDEEIAVARGRGGGTAFWVRCKQKQVTS